MKKRIACLLTALMVLSCGTTVAFAAQSPEASEPVVSVTAPEGVEVTVNQDVAESIEADAAAVAAEVAAAVETEENETATATVLTVVDIHIDAADIPEGGIELSIAVEGVKAGDNIVLLHWLASEERWETIIPTSVGDGVITAVFTSFSPVAIVELEISETTGPSETPDPGPGTTPTPGPGSTPTPGPGSTPAPGNNADAGTAPKTGAALVLPVAALICLAGAAGCARKVKFN